MLCSLYSDFKNVLLELELVCVYQSVLLTIAVPFSKHIYLHILFVTGLQSLLYVHRKRKAVMRQIRLHARYRAFSSLVN